MDTDSYYSNENFDSPIILKNASVWKNLLWRNHSDSCHLIQSTIPDKIDNSAFQLLFTILYLIVWLAAFFGNLCVIYVVSLKQVTLSSVRSVFICSLAVSDILMCLTSLPITAVSLFTRDWVFPRLFCKLSGVFQGGSVFISSFTLTAIAVDRYFFICYPVVKVISFSNAVAIVIFIWILGYCFAMPVGVFSDAEDYSPLCGLFCEETWPDADSGGISRIRKVYGLFVLLIQFGLPMIISCVCYYLIGKVITEQIEKRKQQEIILPKNQQKFNHRKARSNKMMGAMVGGLVLAWLPMNLINLYRDFSSSEKGSEWFSLIFAGCHVVAMTSAVWNPIIYSWFNPLFRDTLKTAFKQKYAQYRRRSTETPTDLPANPSTPSPNLRLNALQTVSL